MTYTFLTTSFLVIALSYGSFCMAASMADDDKERRASGGSGSTDGTGTSDGTGDSGRTTVTMPSPKDLTAGILPADSYDRPFAAVLTATDDILSAEERAFLGEITWKDLMFTGKYLPRPEAETRALVERVITGDIDAINRMSIIYRHASNDKARFASSLWGAYIAIKRKQNVGGPAMRVGSYYKYIPDDGFKAVLESGKALDRHSYWLKWAQKDKDHWRHASEILGEIEAEVVDPRDAY